MAQLLADKWFATLEDAACAAVELAASMPDAERYEYGGVIAELDGRFAFTAPVAGDNRQVAFNFAAVPGVRIAALYHTHPASAGPFFSRADVRIARKRSVPSYLGSLGDGTLRVFDPRDPSTETYYLPGSKARAIGNAGRIIHHLRNRANNTCGSTPSARAT